MQEPASPDTRGRRVRVLDLLVIKPEALYNINDVHIYAVTPWAILDNCYPYYPQKIQSYVRLQQFCSVLTIPYIPCLLLSCFSNSEHYSTCILIHTRCRKH